MQQVQQFLIHLRARAKMKILRHSPLPPLALGNHYFLNALFSIHGRVLAPSFP